MKNRIDERTAEKYLKYLDKYLQKPLRTPKEFLSLIRSIDKPGVRRWFIKGFRNLLNYLEEVEGYPDLLLERLRKVAKTEPSGVREVYISTEELVEAYRHISERYRVLFRLLVYSGIRLEHAVQMLATFDPSNLVIREEFGIARYPLAWTSKGRKREFWAYLPLEFAKELKPMDLKAGTAKEGIRYGRVSASTLRKWNYNFLIMNGVPESVADFIQGRASVTVGSSHYLAKTRQADEWYSRVVEKFPV